MEVIAIFSKLVDQGKPLWKLTQNPRTSPRPVRARTTRQAARRLNAGEVLLTLVEAYQDGATTYELAKHYDIHRGTVSKILERHENLVVTTCSEEKS